MRTSSSLVMRLFSLALASSSAHAQVATVCASVDPSGTPGNNFSQRPAISADARYVAFDSRATNLVATPDTNATFDVFVRDLQTGLTTRVSVDSSGAEGDGQSLVPSISADGRYVAFNSRATNLVAGDTMFHDDIFVHDRATGQTTRVSVTSTGVQANASSNDPAMSGDGDSVAFISAASNLHVGDTNGKYDVFVHDRSNGQTTRVSVGPGGAQANGDSFVCAVSADGRYVAFQSEATNLVGGDDNGFEDVFVHDRVASQTARASVASSGAQANGYSQLPAISSDGRYVAFHSSASNLTSGDTNGKIDVFVRDRVASQTTRVSLTTSGGQGNDHAFDPSISADGTRVSFDSLAGFEIFDHNAEFDVFVHNRITGQTQRASLPSSGMESDGSSSNSRISGDGRTVAYRSSATNFVADTNGVTDVYVGSLAAPLPPTIYCTSQVNSQTCTPQIASTGTPSATSAAPFDISATQILNNKFGLLFYGYTGIGSSFQGGHLCVHPQIRTQAQSSGGSAGPPDCSGSFTFDFNALIQGGTEPNLVPTLSVYAQYWSRDPASLPSKTNLTDALSFEILP